MIRYVISRKDNYQGIDISYIEERYDVTYIGDYCTKGTNNNWNSVPVAVFYQRAPKIELGHSNYLGVFWKIDGISPAACVLVNAESAFEEPIIGIEADNGEIVYSSYRHDFVWSQDRSVFIDGGRDYIKSSLHGKRVYLNMVDGKLEIGEYIV